MSEWIQIAKSDRTDGFKTISECAVRAITEKTLYADAKVLIGAMTELQTISGAVSTFQKGD